MSELKTILDKKQNGLYYGNRILLPFKVHILKATIEKDIITDFSFSKNNATYNITDDFTEIYFHDYNDLQETISKYETIKLIVCENGKDIFNFSNHVKLALDIKDNHILEIEKLADDVLFIE